MPDAQNPRTLDDYGYKEQWSPFGDPDAQDADPAVRNRFFGKYRGTVVANIDPYDQGRLILNVPDVHGILPSNWAMPCLPLTDVGMGTFMRPRIGANVWVEFEQGDPQKPIWVGAFWGLGETPPMAKAAKVVPPVNSVITLETLLSGISISDVPIPTAPIPGTLVLRAGGVATTISLTPAGVTVTAPVLTINAPVVAVNAATSFTVSSGNVVITAPNVTVAAATKFSVASTNFTVT